jgi:hypothetical protein
MPLSIFFSGIPNPQAKKGLICRLNELQLDKERIFP